MSTSLGIFTQQPGDAWTGRLVTTKFNGPVRFEPVTAPKRTDRDPDYRLKSGPAEIGRAWNKPADPDGRLRISVRVSAPGVGTFNAVLIGDPPDDAPTSTGTAAAAQVRAVTATLYYRN